MHQINELFGKNIELKHISLTYASLQQQNVTELIVNMMKNVGNKIDLP